MTISSDYEIVAAGELLVDMIGMTPRPNLAETENFRRFQGGSTANLANNLNLLGKKTALVASIGDDSLGRFLKNSVEINGLESDFIRIIPGCHTSVILVSKTTGTPDFIAFRCADYKINPAQLPEDLVMNSKIFHTTCFGLSRSPAREIILHSSKKALANGAVLSIDLNYSPKIWPDRAEALKVVSQYCKSGALVKISLDDHDRLFQEGTPEDSVARLLDMGATIVCMTKGKEGCLLGKSGQSEFSELPSMEIEVKGDATGAGDAFWAGFLCGYLDGFSPEECAIAGIKVSAIKLQNSGPLSKDIDLSGIYD